MSWLEIILLIAAALFLASLTISLYARWRNPPIGRFLSVDGAKIHYIERGRSDAPALVLLHGNGATLHDFLASRIVEPASERYRVIAIDRPGFGYSSRPRMRIWGATEQAELLSKALDQLGVANPVVLGHSWGVLPALALSQTRPLKGLVLVSGYYFPSFRIDVWLLSGPAIPILGDIIAYTVAPLTALVMLPFLLKKIFAPCPVHPNFQKEFPKSLMLRPWQLRAAAEDTASMIPSAARLSLRYPALAPPVVILAGDADEIVEPDQAQRLRDVLPRSTLRTESGVGHMFHYAAPERVIDAVDLVKAWPQ